MTGKTQSYKISGMTCMNCVAKVKKMLSSHPEVDSVEISLENKAVEILANRKILAQELQKFLGKESKYSIDENPDFSTFIETESEEKSFKPLILIFLFITGISATIAFENKIFHWMNFMRYFMAGFFLVFSFFKFLDLKAFANSYSMYDLLAKRVKVYGIVYPFLELLLGLAYLTNFNPKITYLATIILMGFSSIGVIQSVLNKKQIRCACLGTVFNLPMTTITIMEDLLMVAMAIFMYLGS